MAATLASPFASDATHVSTPSALTLSSKKPSVTFATDGMQAESTGELFSSLYSTTGGGSALSTRDHVIAKLDEKLASNKYDPTSCILIDVNNEDVGVKVCGGLMGASKVKFCTKPVMESDGTCRTASHADHKIDISRPTTFITNKGPTGRKTSAFCQPSVPIDNKFISEKIKVEGETYFK